MAKHELHTISLWAKKNDPVNLEWMEHRAAIKAARQAEFQRLLEQNKQTRADAVADGSAREVRVLAQAA